MTALAATERAQYLRAAGLRALDVAIELQHAVEQQNIERLHRAVIAALLAIDQLAALLGGENVEIH